MKIYWHGDRKNIVGVNVKRLRKLACFTQAQLAEKLQLMGYDFERLTVGRIESGDRFVPDYEVKALADALGVSIDCLFKN